MQELQVKFTPANIVANIDALKVKLEKRLEPYKGIVLPPDQIGEGKKMIAELNKEKKAVDDQCKKVMREHRATADPFYNGMKELVGMYDEATADMKKQVAESEAARKVEIATKLAGELTAKWDELGVNPEFRNAVSDDLATLTAATPAGNLTGKVCQEVLARATADKSLQDRTEMRLLKLENESYKAGLHAPLTRDHVNTFIFADDETYSTELSRVIAAEIGRQEATEKRIEEKRAKEQAPPPAEERQIDIEEVAPREVEAESSGVTVTCVFKPYVPVGATAEALEISLRNQMEDAGFTSLESITVTGL